MGAYSTNVQSDDFLQGITLLTTYKRRQESLQSGISIERVPGVSCKRKDILALTVEDYQTWADPLTKGFISAVILLFSQKIFDARDLPYRTQLVPLAAVFAALGDKANQDKVRQKLLQWYWCGVLGEMYGSATETRFARDLVELLAWIKGSDEPSTIKDANFAPNRLLTLRTRNSAAYKGVSILLMRDGAEDFITGQPTEVAYYFDNNVDIHHIFPVAWCDKSNTDKNKRDSIVNKTPLSSATNRKIGGNAPSQYIVTLERANDRARVDKILKSHLIEPEFIRDDNFDNFFKQRSQYLLTRIENAMGKPILGNFEVVEE